MKPAMQLAVVMAYEAFRICLGLPTKHYPISEVIRWMQTVTQTHNDALCHPAGSGRGAQDNDPKTYEQES